jgi:type I restriction enzyme R subunit
LLQQVIDAINEAYAGEFTDADLVIVEMVLPKILGNGMLASAAAAHEQNVYVEGIFPGILEKIVLEAYTENDKAFASLLNDKAKYMAFLKALANFSYLEFKKKRKVKKAPVDGWGAQVVEEDDGAYRNAAEEDSEDAE